MNTLTPRQRQIFEFVRLHQQTEGTAPSYREVATHFQLSVGTVVDHIQALRRKRFISGEKGRARMLRAWSPLQSHRRPVVDIPIFGSIPAGFAQDRTQEANGCISIDIETLGIKPSPRTFALEVRGDSMIGRHIVEGDLVVLEHGMIPRNGDVVAALIDNESTLKTFVQERGQPWLRAENPRYPKLIPASELVIQGVMVALIRKRK